MGFWGKFRNWTVLTFNGIFLIVGVGAIVLGAKLTHTLNDVSKVIPSSYDYLTATPIALLTLGSIVVLVAILGSIGVLKWNLFLLNVYTVVLLVIFIVHIVVSISTFWAVSNQHDLAVSVNDTVDDVFKKSKDNMDVINYMQGTLECCGPDGPDFWTKSTKSLPDSCREHNNLEGKLFHEGCQNTLYKFLMQSIKITGTLVLVLAPLHVIGATLSLCLINSIRNFDRRYGRYNR